MQNILDKKTSGDFDSCVVQVPKEFALAHGFPEKCFVSLTMKNGKLESEIIEYTDDDEREIKEFTEEFPALDEEMRKIGD